ncbi:hypothetical protein AB0M47_21025 [Hamadaea sp. NPDC051192]|uniref:hypothetical protein n=1 Tax=Hamadaea sp. NPDC051192 TaxID=3154940 RepID=UPI00342EDD1B
MTLTSHKPGTPLRFTIESHCPRHGGPGMFPPGPRVGDVQLRTCADCGHTIETPAYDWIHPANADLLVEG